ncbi:ARM repeat-containing protein [Schizopora paradoxa]|uniref:ARM repeat-containing protein n=1 Tax=Schizopora paradoxa TaxID=27342 RepID=A0A0H2RIB9_9AGAM|nr:ARM repeat-containing protein [Schizopora paradoxa]
MTQTRKGGNAPKKLKFSEKLVGKGLSTDAFLKKLKALHEELASLEQENVDTKSLSPVNRELISTSILLHKDRGVKAYAACCLSDLLRLFAPDAPYTSSEIQDIFEFFVKQLHIGLKGADSSYYTQYYHLLESLSTVKSVVLICDLPQSERLMTIFFRDFFEIVKRNLPKAVEMFLAEILVALIDECQVLAVDVMETIMKAFMDKDASMENSSYHLAVEVCNATADKLQRHVCQYFTDIIVSHSEAEDFDEVEKAHELIKRLNHSCPSLLHNVVPQLDEELKVEDVRLRQMATQVLGEMFADNAGGNLDKKYPNTWGLWLARQKDKSPAVRVSFVEGCKGLLLHVRDDLRSSMETVLKSKLFDPDEKVRAAVCKLYTNLDYETALHHVSEEMLHCIGERTKDKKHIVRKEALTCIAKLYSIALPEIDNNDRHAIAHFSWIPQQIFHAIGTSLEVKPIATKVVAEYVLPLPSKGDDAEAWTDQLLTTMSFLDEKATNALFGISGLKAARPSIFDRYIEACIQHNGGVIDENEAGVKRNLSMTIKQISSLFHNPQTAADDLQTFANINEQRLYKLLSTCIDAQTDLKALVKALGEFTRRTEQANSSILPTMLAFVRQASLWIVNQSSVPTLIKRLRRADASAASQNSNRRADAAADNAQKLLTVMSKHLPTIFKSHVSELIKCIAEDANARLVEACLQALAAVSRAINGVAPTDKRTLERLMRFSRSPDPRHSKFAVRVIANTSQSEDLCGQLEEYICESLKSADPDLLLAHVAALTELVRSCPDAFEQKSDVIVEFLLKNTLMAENDADNMDVDEDTEWIPENVLPSLARAQVQCLKLFRFRCLKFSESESAMDVARPVIKLLIAVLENGGSPKAGMEINPVVKSHLRLQAAKSLLCLSTVDAYAEEMTPNFSLLAFTIQDTCYDVRLRFLTKLIVLLHARKLPPKYSLILFLTVHDPEEELKQKAAGFVALAFRRSPPEYRLTHFEMIFIRLLHLLAHGADFGLSEESMKEQAAYIRNYVQSIATADNISLLYHLAAKAKTVRDAESHTYSENLYALSELAHEVIKRHAKVHSWSLPSYPGKVKLPSDIFRPLPSPEAANKASHPFYRSASCT